MALKDFKRALPGAREVELTTTGRVSGRRISHPVWFIQEDERLYLVPVRGSGSDWYRNVLAAPTVRLRAGEAAYEAQAAPITDPERVRGVVERLRAKYGADQVRQYFAKLDVAVEVPLA